MTVAVNHLWSVAAAKARFSELMEKAANEGPQTVTRNGRPTAVVVSVDEWERMTTRKGTFADFLLNSPLRGSGIDLTRDDQPPRDIDL